MQRGLELACLLGSSSSSAQRSASSRQGSAMRSEGLCVDCLTWAWAYANAAMRVCVAGEKTTCMYVGVMYDEAYVLITYDALFQGVGSIYLAVSDAPNFTYEKTLLQ